MATVPPNELLKLWTLEKITIDMAIGYLIQNQVNQQTALESHGGSLVKLRADVDNLIAHTDMSSKAKGR